MLEHVLQGLQAFSESVVASQGLLLLVAVYAGLLIVGVVVGLTWLCRAVVAWWRRWRTQRYCQAEARSRTR